MCGLQLFIRREFELTHPRFKVFLLWSDGFGAEGSERNAEEGEGRLEQDDSGTESADDGYVSLRHVASLIPFFFFCTIFGTTL